MRLGGKMGPVRAVASGAGLARAVASGAGRGGPRWRALRGQESRTPAPQTPAFAVPETRMVEGDPGRALEKI